MNKLKNTLIESIKEHMLYELKYYGKSVGFYNYRDCINLIKSLFPDLSVINEYDSEGVLIGYACFSSSVKVSGMYFVIGEDDKYVLV
jgi:hypothetical protein